MRQWYIFNLCLSNRWYNNTLFPNPQKLLDNEPSSADQVPLLISMQEDELALVKAIESYDSDLGTKKYLHSLLFGLLIAFQSLPCAASHEAQIAGS